MPVQALPQSVERYWARQHAEIEAANAAVSSLWAEASRAEIVTGYRSVEFEVLQVAERAQLRLASAADGYVDAALEATGQPSTRYGQVSPSALVGLSGDSRPIAGLLRGGPVMALEQIQSGTPRSQALDVAGRWLSLLLTTALSDIARAAERSAMGAVKAPGYVRVLEPPSCSRCAVIAGRWFRSNQGFQRHPRCDCRHMPANREVGREAAVDPRQYFDSLPKGEQDRIFTESGAEAIRNGADISRVVNARRHMVTAQSGRLARQDIFGRPLYVTRTSVRGLPGRQVRLMPESLAEVAGGDLDEYLRLLRVHGYVI